jgi:hypothetical protein
VAVKDAHAKIDSLKRLLTETEMLEAQAELQEMARGMITEIGGSDDTLNRVEEYLTERRDKTTGRSRVASTSIDATKVELLEAEQAALEDHALSEVTGARSLWDRDRGVVECSGALEELECGAHGRPLFGWWGLIDPLPICPGLRKIATAR